MQKTNVTRPSGSAARRGLQIALAALSLAAALTATPVRAEYPAKIIKIVVPFSSGGGTDIIARTLAQEISSDLGKPVIIENKPGAGTVIGTQTVADQRARRLHAAAGKLRPRGQPELEQQASV